MYDLVLWNRFLKKKIITKFVYISLDFILYLLWTDTADCISNFWWEKETIIVTDQTGTNPLRRDEKDCKMDVDSIDQIEMSRMTSMSTKKSAVVDINGTFQDQLYNKKCSQINLK